MDHAVGDGRKWGLGERRRRRIVHTKDGLCGYVKLCLVLDHDVAPECCTLPHLGASYASEIDWLSPNVRCVRVGVRWKRRCVDTDLSGGTKGHLHRNYCAVELECQRNRRSCECGRVSRHQHGELAKANRARKHARHALQTRVQANVTHRKRW